MRDLITRAPQAADPIRRLFESMREKCCKALEDLLNEEIDEALGALRYKRTVGRAGYRNGSYERRVVTASGEVTIGA